MLDTLAHEQQSPPRPIGTRFERVLPGKPGDPRIKSYRAVYEVVGQLKQEDGTIKEDIRRVKLEKID